MFRSWLLLAAAAVGTLAFACGGEKAPPPTATPTPTPTATATPGEFVTEVADLVRAVVRVDLLAQSGDTFEPVANGSGTVISPSGLILTNYHVATGDEDGDGIPDIDFDRLGISVTDSPDRPPAPAFFAEVIQTDRVLDLAVLRIAADADDNPVDPKQLQLPTVRIGDSDAVTVGDELTIIGYPGIGGENITVTAGRVSSFEAEEGLGRRAWIQTDALVSFGNSGGGAFNASGELVAVPTAIAQENIDLLGDRLNLLRPVVLADELIADAQAGRRSVFRSTVPQPEEPTVTPEGPVEGPVFGPYTFALDVDAAGNPVDVVDTVPGGLDFFYIFIDYAGMTDGVSVGFYCLNTDVQTDYGPPDYVTWEFGSEGAIYFDCATEDGSPLPPGPYDVFITTFDEVGEEVIIVDNDPAVDVFVGGGGGTGEYGSDPALDALWDSCEAGDMADCDQLYFDSPVGSEYEEFGDTCGGRQLPGTGVLCVDAFGQ